MNLELGLKSENSQIFTTVHDWIIPPKETLCATSIQDKVAGKKAVKEKLFFSKTNLPEKYNFISLRM